MTVVSLSRTPGGLAESAACCTGLRETLKSAVEILMTDAIEFEYYLCPQCEAEYISADDAMGCCPLDTWPYWRCAICWTSYSRVADADACCQKVTR